MRVADTLDGLGAWVYADHVVVLIIEVVTVGQFAVMMKLAECDGRVYTHSGVVRNLGQVEGFPRRAYP